ncbi:TraR/DksA C4-type zinc finger protein [Peribacillus sp. NPDC097225]|uniref:TraR/DksA C4-type zinc finger protein n=1 Tax=Peribacillus sp. NPDC097225 TaxID=3364400 RepID=UPI003829E7A3
MATEKQILKLKEELLSEKEQLQQRIKNDETVTKQSQTDFSGEISSYDNHPADLGTELFDKERYQAINEHAEEEIGKIDLALEAIKEGTYGVCKECGKDIPYERLEVVPSTLYCIEHTPEQKVHDDVTDEYRPAEEDILIPSKGDNFENRRHSDTDDENTVKEDSFGEVAQFGTSDTPADYQHNRTSYNELYDTEDDTETFPEDYEGYAANDIEGKNRQVVSNENKEEYEDMLDDRKIDSKMGNIPYKKKDSYIDEK